MMNLFTRLKKIVQRKIECFLGARELANESIARTDAQVMFSRVCVNAKHTLLCQMCFRCFLIHTDSP